MQRREDAQVAALAFGRADRVLLRRGLEGQLAGIEARFEGVGNLRAGDRAIEQYVPGGGKAGRNARLLAGIVAAKQAKQREVRRARAADARRAAAASSITAAHVVERRWSGELTRPAVGV